MMAGVLEQLSDEELARRARAGSAACFEELMRRYQVPLFQFISGRFASRRDVEDILQDTFVKAWQRLDRFDDQFAFRTWLYTIGYRLAVSRGRRETTKVESLPAYAASTATTPEASLQREELQENIWSVARQVLTQEQYLSLWLFYVDELPAGDVARILQRSWVSVKTMMHRARKKLQPYLHEHAIDRGHVAIYGIAGSAGKAR